MNLTSPDPPPQVHKLKFRTFSSKQRQGFILFAINGKIPLIVLQDILFQLFQPLFPSVMCPQIYFFSSTDQILKVEDIYKIQDFIYVHFLERIPKYNRQKTIDTKFKLCLLDKLSQGLGLQSNRLYIFSEKQYMMYLKGVFMDNTLKSIEKMNDGMQRKELLYERYFKELETLKDSVQMISLKEELDERVKEFQGKVENLEVIQARFVKAKQELNAVLKESGINIKSLSDLY